MIFSWMQGSSAKERIFLSVQGALRKKSRCALFAVFLVLVLTGCSMGSLGILNPKGLISYEERRLFFDTLALMLIVVLPVIVMSITFLYHYRASHPSREYKPNWSHSYFLEILWWGIPCLIIVVLGVLTWKKTHELDPYRKITPPEQAVLLIQAIALPWKWLFIYPQQGVATVNYLVLPVNQEVEFWITADNVPMSAFFIPQLSSQIYAMAGMRTQLHLLANQTGDYEGMNALFNGAGFSDMYFTVHVVPVEEMHSWFLAMGKKATHLTETVYRQLLSPSMHNQPQFYSGVQPRLFEEVIHLYMHSLGPQHPREKPVDSRSQKK